MVETKENSKRPNDLLADSYDAEVTVNGAKYPARKGESILSLLFALGIKDISQNDHRMISGAYCGMGVCFCCTVEVNGKSKVRACKTGIKNGMNIRTKKNLITELKEVARK